MPRLVPKPMNLRDWIDETGSRQVAALLKVDVRSIFHWRRGVCLPRVEQMALIRKYSHGKVSYDSMISSYLKNRRRPGSSSKQKAE